MEKTAVCTKIDKFFLVGIAAENSAALEELAASNFFIDVAQNIVPAERLEKGVPIVWGNKSVIPSFEPDWDNSSSQTGSAGAHLKGFDELVLICVGFVTE